MDWQHKDKVDLTRQLIELAEFEVDLATGLQFFWANMKADGGYRLTERGLVTLTNLLKFHPIRLENPVKVTSSLLLSLDRGLELPYYIHITRAGIDGLILFDERMATMALLYGDITVWAEHLPLRTR